jgi:hypothetical protein
MSAPQEASPSPQPSPARGEGVLIRALRRVVGRHRQGRVATPALEGEFELARTAAPMGADLLPSTEAEPDIGSDAHQPFRRHAETSTCLPGETSSPLQPCLSHGRCPRRAQARLSRRKSLGCRKAHGPVATRCNHAAKSTALREVGS